MSDSTAHGAADRLNDHVRRVVDRAPPLTQEQRDRIAALLGARPKWSKLRRAPAHRPAGANGGDAA